MPFTLLNAGDTIVNKIDEALALVKHTVYRSSGFYEDNTDFI